MRFQVKKQLRTLSRSMMISCNSGYGEGPKTGRLLVSSLVHTEVSRLFRISVFTLLH